jgi:hypothetical protein
MKKLTSALAAILVIGSASVALADDPAIDQAADAIRAYGPLVNHSAPFATKNVALSYSGRTGSSWMDRASQTSDAGGN